MSEDSIRRTTKWHYPYSLRPSFPFSYLSVLCDISTGNKSPFCMLFIVPMSWTYILYHIFSLSLKIFFGRRNCCYEVNFHCRWRMWLPVTYQYSTYIRGMLCMAITAEEFRMWGQGVIHHCPINILTTHIGSSCACSGGQIV